MRIVENCDECPNLRSKNKSNYCSISKKEHNVDEYGEWDIPDWCTLPRED